MKQTISTEEFQLAKHALAFAVSHGAIKARVTLSKTVMNLFGIRDGALDKVTQSLDRSLSFNLFVDGRYGTYSINRLEKATLEKFILNAVETTRMLAPDPARDLPDISRTANGAVDGLDLYDPAVEDLDSEARLAMALKSAPVIADNPDYKLVSVEGEYSDSVSDTLILDSNSLECRSSESSFETGYEVTVEAPDGSKFSGYWWDSSPKLGGLDLEGCAYKALERAVAQIGPQKAESARTNVVVDTECASKLFSPLLSALGGYAQQQRNSFLLDSLGKEILGTNVSIVDKPLEKGRNGARRFDSEGVATSEADIIRDGVIRRYFVNTFIANKTGLAPTIEDASRPVLIPCGGLKTKEELIRKAGNGILVTGFNGGNCNSSTGDFSYGVDGFLFRDGKIVHPVREILMTGNLVKLWRNLIATADDARSCLSRQVPSLAFANVDISA